MIIFGDSLSDTGNLASVQGDFPFPYFYNRVSNGPIMVDILAEQLGLEAAPSLHLTGPPQGSNFAVASAKAGGTGVFDLAAQVQAFLAASSGQASSTALYLISIGGNDVRSARDTASFLGAFSILRTAADAIALNIQTLIQAGARNFLVADAPDIGSIPETRIIAEQLGDSNFVRQATFKSFLFNLLIKQRLGTIKKNFDVRLTKFRSIPISKDIIHNASGLGLANTEGNCFSSLNFQFTPACKNGSNLDQFFYFDEFHPTSVVHQRIGRALYALVPMAAE
ncbi:MAG: SGNH/GDSL hydrolase family protein [Desulfobacterales bacterium]